MNKYFAFLLLIVSINIEATSIVPDQKIISVAQAADYGITIVFQNNSYPCAGLAGVIVKTPESIQNEKLLFANVTYKGNEILPIFIERSNGGNKLMFCTLKENQDTLILGFGYMQTLLLTTNIEIKLYEN